MSVLHAQGQATSITEIYALVSVDAQGNEAVCSFEINGTKVPMIGTELIAFERSKSVIDGLAKKMPHPVKLIKFSHREEVPLLL